MAGGFQDMGVGELSTALDGAEVYDPATRCWTPTGSMGTPRFFHAAVLLPDGRVLLAGGCRGWTGDPEGYSYQGCLQLSTAETWDPATGSWTPTGAMQSTRRGPGLLLPDGRVLVVGSETGSTAETFTAGGGSGAL